MTHKFHVQNRNKLNINFTDPTMGKKAQGFDELRKICALELLNSLNSKFMTQLKEIKPLRGATNTKGGEYEKVLTKSLKQYFASRFQFHSRSILVDAQMEYLKIFSYGENEIDIVATFNISSPQIVIKKGALKYVPYDATAFIIEVKSKLTKSDLSEDLSKLEQISKLPLSPNRFMSGTIGHPQRVQRPLRILFYYEESIDRMEMEKLLNSYNRAWDLIFIVKKDELVLNMSLDLVKKLSEISFPQGSQEEDKILILSWKTDAYLLFLLCISALVPFP